MSAVLISVALVLVWSVARIVQLGAARTEPATFGADKDGTWSAEYLIQLLLQAAKQQRWTFALVMVAIAIGVVLAAMLLGRIILAPALDLEALGAAIGAVADIWLGRRAWKLFQFASKRLDDLTSQLTSLRELSQSLPTPGRPATNT